MGLSLRRLIEAARAGLSSDAAASGRRQEHDWGGRGVYAGTLAGELCVRSSARSVFE